MGSSALRRMAQENLGEKEEAIYAYHGICVKGDEENQCVVVVTQKRVLCCSRRLIAKEMSEIPLLRIQGMQITKGKSWMSRELRIEGFLETIIISSTMDRLNLLRTAIQYAIDHYEELNMPGAFDGAAQEQAEEEFETEEVPTVTAQSIAGPSAAQELREWKALLDEGAITQEEYNAKKKQLLGL